MSIQPFYRVGDAVFFWGNGLLSKAIEDATHGGPSHVAVVRQTGAEDPLVIQSTIEDGRDGVQSTPLSRLWATYPAGSRRAFLPLSAAARQRLNLFAFYRACGDLDGHVTYDKIGLVEFLARDLPVIGSHWFQGEKTSAMVCSALAACLYVKAGVLPVTLNWTEQSPGSLLHLPGLFDPAVTL